MPVGLGLRRDLLPFAEVLKEFFEVGDHCLNVRRWMLATTGPDSMRARALGEPETCQSPRAHAGMPTSPSISAISSRCGGGAWYAPQWNALGGVGGCTSSRPKLSANPLAT